MFGRGNLRDQIADLQLRLEMAQTSLKYAREDATRYQAYWRSALDSRRDVLEQLGHAKARLADLQAQQRDAGAQAFAAIVREAEFSRSEQALARANLAALEQRVAALIVPYGATQESVRTVARSAKLGWPYGKAVQPQREVRYEGHAGDGGIQGHSIGEEYPFVVYGQQFVDGVKYRVLDTRTGGIYWAKLSSSESASNFVAQLKRENRYVREDGRLS